VRKKMVLLTGPRQVGKTTLARSLGDSFQNPLYLNYDALTDRPSIERAQWLPTQDYLVIDGGAQEIVFNLREDLMTVWLHQFLKVRVLRAIFETMPGDLRQAKSMDTHIRGLEKFFPVRRLQSQKSFIVLEESLSRGIPTAEGYRALQSRNLDIPRELRKVSLKALIQFGLRHRRLPFYLLR
jgi:adenylate kinase family enzyme